MKLPNLLKHYRLYSPAEMAGLTSKTVERLVKEGIAAPLKVKR